MQLPASSKIEIWQPRSAGRPSAAATRHEPELWQRGLETRVAQPAGDALVQIAALDEPDCEALTQERAQHGVDRLLEGPVQDKPTTAVGHLQYPSLFGRQVPCRPIRA